MKPRTRIVVAAALSVLLIHALVVRAASVPLTDDLLLHLAADGGVTTSGSTVINWADQATAVGGANNATGTVGTGPTLIANSIGGLPSLDFNGTSQYLTVAANPAFQTDQFAWFIVGQTDVVTPSSSADHFIRASYSNQSAMWGTFVQDGLFKSNARTGAGGFVASTVAVTNDPALISARWASDDSVNSSVNGVSGTAGAGATMVPATHLLTRIGANTASINEYLDGRISEVLVYNTTLAESEANIVRGYLRVKYRFIDKGALSDGLVLYSPMDDDAVHRGGTYPPPALSTAGGDWTVDDRIGTPQNGTATSGSASGTVTSSAAGVVRKALDFSPTEAGERRANYGDVLDIDSGSQSQTVSLWFNSRESNTTSFIASNGNAGSTNDGWGIFLLAENGGELVVRADYNGSNNGTQRLGVNRAFGAADEDVWHHIVVVIDNDLGTILAYYDGLGSGAAGTDNAWELGGGGGQTNTFAPGRTFSNTDPLLLGARFTAGAMFNGLIDEFYIWDRALSAQEIADLYNLGLAGQSVIPAPAAMPAGLAIVTLVSLHRRRR